MRNWRFEVYDGYTPTEWTFGLLAWTVVVIGFEVRPSFPKDDKEYPGYGAAVGIVVLNWWVGWFKFKV